MEYSMYMKTTKVGSYQSNIEIRNTNTKRTYLSKNFSSVNQSQQNSTELFSILYCALLEEKKGLSNYS